MIKRGYWPIMGIAVIGIFLSAIGFKEVYSRDQDKRLANFNISSAVRIDAIEQSILHTISSVEIIKSLFESQQNISRSQFKSFITPILEREPSIQALEWVPKVSNFQRPSFERNAQRDGLLGFQFTELSENNQMVQAKEREEYYPVYYVEPAAGNEDALGYDLGSDPSRLATLNNARISGALATSEPITLAHNGEAAVLVFNPIYSYPDSPENDGLQERALTGYASGVIQIDEMIKNAFSGHSNLIKPAGIDLHIYDITNTDTPSLVLTHDSRARQTEAAPELEYAIAITGVQFSKILKLGNRNWLIVAKAADETLYIDTHWQQWLILLSGLILTGLLCLLMVINANKRRDIEILVQSRTRDLNEAKNRVSAIVENTAEGIITIDSKGIIETVNAATENIFGYEANELIGQNVNILMPLHERKDHDGYLQKSDLHVARIINNARDLEGVRKDASAFPMELNVSNMPFAGEKKFIGLVRDITERKQAEKIKSEFISTISHELRTPLTSILGALSLIKGGSAGEFPAPMLGMLDIAHNNSERLVRLINDILDVEKIESGKMVYAVEPTDLGELIEQAIVSNETYATLYNSKYTSANIIPGLKVLADPSRIMQVLSNLMSNAAKFSPDDPAIELSMKRLDDTVQIRISDHGVGIPDSFKSTIFEKFTQADPSDTRQKGGTGLGLNISKAIIEYHNGEIGFDSTLHKGTTFYFNLPIFDDPNVAFSENSEKEEDATGILDRIEKPIDQNQLKPGSGGTISHPHNKTIRILHVEDEPDVQIIVSSVIKNIGLDLQGGSITSARSLTEAKRFLSENTYNLVILDLELPDGNGENLLPLLNKENEQPTPVIIFSVTEVPRKISDDVYAALLKSQTSNEKLATTIQACLNDLPKQD